MLSIVSAYPHSGGQGKKSRASGSKFEIYEHNLHSEYHIRYNGYGGIAYHHVSDKYIALFTHFITCGVWEAVYLLDGLLKNVSDIQPDTVYGDTQSAECTAACDLECIRGRSAVNLLPFLLFPIFWELN